MKFVMCLEVLRAKGVFELCGNVDIEKAGLGKFRLKAVIMYLTMDIISDLLPRNLFFPAPIAAEKSTAKHTSIDFGALL